MIFRIRFFVNRERGSCASSFSTVSSNLGFGAPYSWAQRGASDELRRSIIIERLDNQKGPLPGYMDVLTRMERQGRIPSVNSYRSILKECGKRKALTFAKRVHAHLAKHGLESNRSLGEFVVSILVKCGDIEAALQVFRRLPHRTVLSWTAIISGYTSTGQSQRAIRMFQWMKEEGVQPNAFTIVSLLKACGAMASLEEGKRIHEEAVKHSLCAAGSSRESFGDL